MEATRLTKKDYTRIERCVELFVDQMPRLEQLAKSVLGQLCIHPRLTDCIHFIKYRIKDPKHLHMKLERKELERKASLKAKEPQTPDAITPDNLFKRVNDLAGIRLIHLHTQQLDIIHPAILEVFEEQMFELIEDPVANCWDSEYERIYKGLGIQTRTTEGYSSIHYVLRANNRTDLTCELQVRTLTDEVWGEVSHRVNYPDPSPSELCIEQLKTLARFTTGCTRLVDAIYASDRIARDATSEPGEDARRPQ